MFDKPPAQARAVQFLFRDKLLACMLCGQDQFRSRMVLLNSRGLTLMGMDWANRDALAVTCAGCGHILWFAGDDVSKLPMPVLS